MPICTLTGTLQKLDGTPAIGQQVLVTIQSTQIDQSGQFAGIIGVISDAIEAVTDDTGLFTIDLLQGAVVLLEVPTINLRKQITIPALNTVEFSTLV